MLPSPAGHLPTFLPTIDRSESFPFHAPMPAPSRPRRHEALSFDLRRTIFTDHGGEAYISGLARALADAPGAHHLSRPSLTPGSTGTRPSVPIGIPVAQGHGAQGHGAHGAVATGSRVPPSPPDSGPGRLPHGHRAHATVATGSRVPPAPPPVSGPGRFLHRKVAVCGLVSMPEYNGRVGRAVSWDPRAKRYSVALDGPAGQGEEVSIKPENLELR
jgi:hypothetical protein